MISRWVSWHDRCVYNAIDGVGVLNAMLVDCDGSGLKADYAKGSYALWQVLVICTGGELKCMLIFGCCNWRSIKEDIIKLFLKWSFAYTEIIFSMAAMWHLSHMGDYF